MQQRIDELKARLEILRREAGEIEFLIKGYEDTMKQQEENKDNGETKPKKKVAEPVAA